MLTWSWTCFIMNSKIYDLLAISFIYFRKHILAMHVSSHLQSPRSLLSFLLFSFKLKEEEIGLFLLFPTFIEYTGILVLFNKITITFMGDLGTFWNRKTLRDDHAFKPRKFVIIVQGFCDQRHMPKRCQFACNPMKNAELSNLNDNYTE